VLAQMGDRKGGDRDVMGMGGDGGLEMERFWGVSESCGKDRLDRECGGGTGWCSQGEVFWVGKPLFERVWTDISELGICLCWFSVGPEGLWREKALCHEDPAGDFAPAWSSMSEKKRVVIVAIP